MIFSPLTLLLLSPSALATPTHLFSRAAAQCNQYDSQTAGPYTLSTNGWGWPAGRGIQCSQIDSLSGNNIAWSTIWSWRGAPVAVKSFTNVYKHFTQKPLKAYTSMPTTWRWSYTGKDVRANVAYDSFVGHAADGNSLFEVMVWIGVYGDVGPLSANGYPFKPINQVKVGGVTFDLAYGLNKSVKVFSFIAQGGRATTFSADLNEFFKYLIANYGHYGFNGDLPLTNVQAGTEVSTGSGARFITSAYSIDIN